MALFLWEKVKIWWLAPLHVVAFAGAGSPHDGDVAAQTQNGAVADPADREDPELDLLACREAIERERGDIGTRADPVAPGRSGGELPLHTVLGDRQPPVRLRGRP